MTYRLYYWPGLQGRGEYVRLALEEVEAPYEDVALVPSRRGGGSTGVMRLLSDASVTRPAFAVPALETGKLLIGQTANILLYLGGRHGLAPRREADRLWTHQLQLTISDLLAEIHDNHHPLSSSLYYEQQKREARRRTQLFLADRVPKFLDYFERVCRLNKTRTPWMVGRRLSYVDLSMAQVIAGLRYAFPFAAARVLRSHPRLVALHEAAFERPRIRQYLVSARRQPFNNDDLFRHYPELDRAR